MNKNNIGTRMKGTRMRFKNAEQYLESRNELFMKITLAEQRVKCREDVLTAGLISCS